MRSDRRTIAFIGAPGDHNSHDDDHGDDHDVLGQKGKYTLFIFQSSLKRGSPTRQMLVKIIKVGK